MQKLIVPASRQKERFEICQACPHYFAATRSCGPLIVGRGRRVTETDANGKKKNFKLCGCQLDAKTWVAVERCPGGKWGDEMTMAEKRAMLEYLTGIWGTKQMTDADRKILQKYSVRLTGSEHPVLKGACRSCGAAVAEWIETTRNELKKVVGENEDQPPVKHQ